MCGVRSASEAIRVMSLKSRVRLFYVAKPAQQPFAAPAAMRTHTQTTSNKTLTMASLVHMTAKDIISLTADDKVNNGSKVVVKGSMDNGLEAKETPQEKNKADAENDGFSSKHHVNEDGTSDIVAAGDDSVPFCVSGSMTTYSYAVTGGMDSSGGMIMYMDGAYPNSVSKTIGKDVILAFTLRSLTLSFFPSLHTCFRFPRFLKRWPAVSQSLL